MQNIISIHGHTGNTKSIMILQQLEINRVFIIKTEHLWKQN